MRWVVVVGCTACGRLAFDEIAAAPDGPSDGPGVGCEQITFDQVPAGFTIIDNGGTLELTGGQVHFSIPGTLNSDVYLQRTDAGSFVGRTVAIQVVSPSLIFGASTGFGWHEQNGERIGVHMEMDGLNLKLNQYNSTLDQYTEFVAQPYDPVAFGWWRLRSEDELAILAEVSSDGVVWNPFGTVTGRDLALMKWDVGMGAYTTAVAPSEATVDNASDCKP